MTKRGDALTVERRIKESGERVAQHELLAGGGVRWDAPCCAERSAASHHPQPPPSEALDRRSSGVVREEQRGGRLLLVVSLACLAGRTRARDRLLLAALQRRLRVHEPHRHGQRWMEVGVVTICYLVQPRTQNKRRDGPEADGVSRGRERALVA